MPHCLFVSDLDLLCLETQLPYGLHSVGKLRKCGWSATAIRGGAHRAAEHLIDTAVANCSVTARIGAINNYIDLAISHFAQMCSSLTTPTRTLP